MSKPWTVEYEDYVIFAENREEFTVEVNGEQVPLALVSITDRSAIQELLDEHYFYEDACNEWQQQ